jgi:hypothetical protein
MMPIRWARSLALDTAILAFNCRCAGSGRHRIGVFDRKHRDKPVKILPKDALRLAMSIYVSL